MNRSTSYLVFLSLALQLLFVSSSSDLDNNFETDFGIWTPTAGDCPSSETFWVVQNFDEYWGIPQPAQGTAYASVLRRYCSAQRCRDYLKSPLTTVRTGDVISFKYFLVDVTNVLELQLFNGDDLVFHVLLSLKGVADAAEAKWSTIVVPINTSIWGKESMDVHIQFMSNSYGSKVGLDDVRYIPANTTGISEEQNASVIDNDFETDMGAWKNVPLGYSGGWLIENYSTEGDIRSPPINGTSYARAFRYNCSTDYVKMRMESIDVTVNPGDALAFSIYPYGSMDATLRVVFVSNGEESLIVQLGLDSSEWETYIVPIDILAATNGKVAFELESLYEWDNVAVDNIRLLSRGTWEGLEKSSVSL